MTTPQPGAAPTVRLIDKDSANAHSADLLQANIARLQALFPDAFTEGRIDFEVLKSLLGAEVDEREEKYGLNWHGKRRARQLALTPSTGTLRPCPEESVDWGTTQNLMIEGDNLEVLKLLQKSYAGKVKLIYIDPPYNTGKDFVYPDNFQDSIKNYLELTGQVEGGQRISSNTEASGRFHTDWLNMIYPRVKLARTLLSNDGVLLVSIDDHEVANMRKILDEVLGEENFLSCLTWEKSRKNDAKFFSNGHENVLVYARDQPYLRELKTLWREEKPGAREIWDQYVSLRTKHGEKDAAIEAELQGWYSELPKGHPSKKWSRYKRVDKYGPWRDDNISWPGGGGPTYDVPHPTTGIPCKVPERGWIFASYAEMQRRISLGVVEFREDHTEPPFRKSHIRPVQFELVEIEPVDASDHEDEVEEDEELATQVRGSYFYKQSQVSVKYLRELFGGKVFDNPKDVQEIARLVRYATSDDPEALVLDFFAGSGTTGEAVMRLNAEDGGKRRFILVQLPEMLDPSKKDQKAAAKYCDNISRPRAISELTRQRLRLAAKRVASEGAKLGCDFGFRSFELDTSNIRAWNPNPDDLQTTVEEHTEHLLAHRDEQDVLYELLLKLGLELAVPIETRQIAGKTVHNIGAGALMACLSDGIDRDVAEPLALGIAQWQKAQAESLQAGGDDKNKPVGTKLVFKDSAFADDVAKTNLAAILSQHGLDDVRSI